MLHFVSLESLNPYDPTNSFGDAPYFLIANQPQKSLNQECQHAIIIIIMTKFLIIFPFEKNMYNKEE